MKFLYWVFLLSFACLNFNSSAYSNELTRNQTLNGETLTSLSIRWWQWVTNAPDELDPLADDTGDRCSYGQSGDVFFLAPSYSFDPVVRNCHISLNKYIFLPVISTMRWDVKGGVSCKNLQHEAKALIDSARDMLIELDGQKLSPVRAATLTCFAIPGDDDHYTSDGYWLLLSPLSQGEHRVHFKGIVGDISANQDEYKQDIEYKLNIE